jgi:hypothetical protein
LNPKKTANHIIKIIFRDLEQQIIDQTTLSKKSIYQTKEFHSVKERILMLTSGNQELNISHGNRVSYFTSHTPRNAGVIIAQTKRHILPLFMV